MFVEKLCYVSVLFSFILSKFNLSPCHGKIIVLLFSSDDNIDENSLINCVIFALHELGGHILAMVIFKMLPVTWMIKTSQYSYIFKFICISAFYIIIKYINKPHFSLHSFTSVIHFQPSRQSCQKSSLSAFHILCRNITLNLKLLHLHPTVDDSRVVVRL